MPTGFCGQWLGSWIYVTHTLLGGGGGSPEHLVTLLKEMKWPIRKKCHQLLIGTWPGKLLYPLKHQYQHPGQLQVDEAELSRLSPPAGG